MFSSPASLVMLSWFGLALVVVVSLVTLWVIARFSRRRRALAKALHEEGLVTGEPSSEIVSVSRRERRRKHRWEGAWGQEEHAKVTFMPDHNILEVRVEPHALPADTEQGWVMFQDRIEPSANGKDLTRPALFPVWPVWAQALFRAPRRSPDAFPGYALLAVIGTPGIDADLLQALRPHLTNDRAEWSIATRGHCVWIRRRGSNAHAAWPAVKAVLEAVQASLPRPALPR